MLLPLLLPNKVKIKLNFSIKQRGIYHISVYVPCERSFCRACSGSFILCSADSPNSRYSSHGLFVYAAADQMQLYFLVD
jgi:hypothetical protein